ncbi:MAG: glycosyltransferase family 2 protein [Acidobacteriia bacterium]|nr:glycosyltransferase family 2 protein [Terriglobia bacterium]
MSELREISEVNAKSARNESVSIGKVSVNYGTSVTGEDQSDPEVTILMPCLNESETLEVCIRKAQGFLDANQVRGEIVVSDNGSTDGSQEIARSCGARVVDVPIRGYGAALIYGSRAARGKYIIMGDSDDSYDFSDMLPFVRELRGGSELVMGNRFRGEIKPGAMPWLNRWLGTPVLSALGRLFFGSPIGDFNCGLRGFSAGAFQKMDLRTNGMEFASEMIVKATLLKLKISEVPTTLSPDGRSRPPHLRRWRDGWRHLRFMLLYSPRWLFLYPGGLLMTLGLLLSLWLLPGPRFIGRVGFDIHTMIYAAIMMFVGYQAVTFAVFTKVFAITHGLLPKDAKFHRAFRITLETGLAVGGVLVALGLIISMVALGYWERRGFGPLDPIRTLRVVTPGTICLTIGFQTVFSSFFLSVLGLVKR